ncbi:MAG: aminotransferase class I/II-fold pyridoxal phosphate-dependent enzyme [Chthoniobacteraceae bacterium]
MSKDIQRNLLPLTARLREAMELLDAGVSGAVFVVDSDGVMQGIFTDADVRRALLAGAQLEDESARWMNRKFTAGRASATHEDNLRLLSKSIRHLPILDDAGRPVEFLSWAEIWKLPVTQPSLGGNELKYVSDCIATSWISSQGGYVTQFEQAFARFHDVPHALTVSNGTTALHLALVALGIGPGDEVIVPDLTFAASANVVIHCGAKPVLADVDARTWTLDPADFARKITPRTKAVMPVHLYGHPCDMDPIMEVARLHRLFVVEDCAEALGARYKGRLVGTFGDAGCFSFFANKVITTGEGGMVFTRDVALHQRMNVLRDHGMEKGRRYWHIHPGFNYRMTNIQAAIGLAQMERIDFFLERHREIARHYSERLRGLPGITLPPAESWAENIYWLYSILIDEARAGLTRDALVRYLAEHGVETRNLFYPLHIMPPYPHEGDLPVSTQLSARGLSLPTSKDLEPAQIDRVCDAIAQALEARQPAVT